MKSNVFSPVQSAVRGVTQPYAGSSIRFVNNKTILAGNGSTASATLLDNNGNPVAVSNLRSVNAIYKTDWQGQQMLSSTPRTNYVYPSDAIASWSKASGITESAATAFAGTSMAPQLIVNAATVGSASITPTGSTGGSGTACGWIVVETSSTNKSPSCILRIYDTTSSAYVIGATLNLSTGAVTLYAGSGTYGATILSNNGPNGGTVYLFWVSGTITSGHATTLTFFPTAGGNVVGQVIVHCAQIEEGSAPKDYIHTTSAAVTVTDYSLSGVTVNLSPAPLTNSTVSWSGSLYQ